MCCTWWTRTAAGTAVSSHCCNELAPLQAGHACGPPVVPSVCWAAPSCVSQLRLCC